MKKESVEKIEEFKKEYGMQELSLDDLDNVGGGVGIGLNTQESVASFCKLVDVLIITEGLEEAIKIVSQFLPSPQVKDIMRTNGAQGLGAYLYGQITGGLKDKTT
jgi:hypothetical protein